MFERRGRGTSRFGARSAGILLLGTMAAACAPPSEVPAPAPEPRAVPDKQELSAQVGRLLGGAGSLSAVFTEGRLARLFPPAAITQVFDRQQALRRLLSERILTAENLEREEAGAQLYRLRPEVTCQALDGAGSDARCQRLLGALAVRARVTSAASGSGSYRVQFLVGEAAIEPLMIQVSSQVLNAYLNLPQLKASAGLIAAALGENDPLPARMSGQLRVSLASRADAAELMLYVPYDIEVSDQARGIALRVTSAEALGRVLIASAEAGSGRRFLDLSFGPSELRAPWPPAPAPGRTSRPARIALGALLGRLTWQEGQAGLTASRVTLGARPALFSVGDQTVVEALVNPSPRDAYDFQLEVSPAADGSLVAELSPRLDLQARFNLAAVADDLPRPPPDLLRDQSYQLTIEGPREDPRRGARFEELLSGPGAAAGGLRVARGELSLYASGAPRSLDAIAGQCLLEKTPGPGEHPLLGRFELAACPSPPVP